MKKSKLNQNIRKVPINFFLNVNLVVLSYLEFQIILRKSGTLE